MLRIIAFRAIGTPVKWLDSARAFAQASVMDRTAA
jgi:hypothetical protein